MPDENPEFADIYGVAPWVVPDAHNARRRRVVVQPRTDVITVVGRTSKRAEFDAATCLLSEIDHSCRLDKEGMFDLRYTHGVYRSHFSVPADCEYYGPLGEVEATQLQEFWDRFNGF